MVFTLAPDGFTHTVWDYVLKPTLACDASKSFMYVAPCCCTRASHTLSVWAPEPRLTGPLGHVSSPLAPDAVDGRQDAVPGLHRVEDGALHGGVAGATDSQGHVVARLEHVLDTAFDVIHYLRHRATMFTGTSRLESLDAIQHLMNSLID